MEKPTEKYLKIFRILVEFNVVTIDKKCILRRILINWSYQGVKTNQIMHSLNGNKKIGYKIAFWNCRRRLLDPDGSQSDKITDIKLYLKKHQLHMFGIIESDLHGSDSRVKRKNPLQTKDIHENLHIDGYYIMLPQSWQCHGQARLIVYVKNGVHVKERKLDKSDSDLPSLSVELGLSREKKTCINMFYREFTGGVSGLGDTASQQDRLARQIGHWKNLFETGKDVLILGDSNLCAHKWEEDNYNHKQLANMVQDFLLEEASQQLVTKITRSELVAGEVQTSCIDHCYSDVEEKINGPFVEAVGDSDHLGVRIIKYCRTPVVKPQVMKKRCYKNFSVEHFLSDIYHSNINTSVATHETIDGAAEAFRNEFAAILNFHAPVKTIQIRNKYCPYLTKETKILIAERNVLHEEASKSSDTVLMEEFKLKAKEVRKSGKLDKRQGQVSSLNDQVSSSQAWNSVRNILGIKKNLAPTAVKDKEGKLVTNPGKLATMFNDFFLEKVRLLRAKTDSPPKIDPVTRLRGWLAKSGKSLPPFKLKEINRRTLRKLIKKMKGGKSCGIDGIDSFSLKLAAPLIEETLEHLINLSIRTNTFSSFWKHQLIFPLHKKSAKNELKNFRPVSHLVEVGKLIEYAVYDQVTEHFHANNLFHENHHGGLPHHSTATALIQLHDMFLEAAKNKKLTAALLLDQSAAYDLLDHEILLLKLAVYNFDENSISWFQSYLEGRSQSVQV